MAHSTFTLTGKHTSPSGTAHSGTVKVTPNAVIRDVAGAVVMAGPDIVKLDASGAWSLVLPCDSPGLNPATGIGFTVEYLFRAESLEPQSFYATADLAGSTVDAAGLVTTTVARAVTTTIGPQLGTATDGTPYLLPGDPASAAANRRLVTEARLDIQGVPAYNLRAGGLDDATPDIGALLTAAVAAGKRHIVIPYRASAWPMTSTLTASGVWLDFEPGARISFNMSTRAMDLTACRLTNASFTSPYAGPSSAADVSPTGPYAMFAREVRLGSDCVVDGYYHENASAGIHIDNGNNITIRNVAFKNVRQYQGWAAAIHVAGASAYNVRIDGVKIEDSDRGIEIESGARDVSADNGHQRNIFPKPYTGQPADFATYTFVLGAHSHDGEGACINITHKNWLIENCGSAVVFVRSNGTNPADHPRNCSAENIRVLGMAMTTGYECIAVQGYNNVVRGVHLMAGAGVTPLMRLRVWGGSSENNRLEDVRAEAYALPLVTVDDAATGTVLGNFRPTLPVAGAGYIFDIMGRYTTIAGASVYSVTGTAGYVRFQSTADYSQIDGLNYNIATAETFPQVVLVDGAENVRVSGVQGANFATVPPIDVSLAGAARFCNVSGNNFDRSGAGAVVALAAPTSRNLVHANVFGTSLGTVTDSGIENAVVGNKRGNWIESATGTATIPDGAASVTFNHGVSGAPEVVLVTPRLAELLWVSAITGTQVTVSRSGTTGAHAFGWQAENSPAT